MRAARSRGAATWSAGPPRPRRARGRHARLRAAAAGSRTPLAGSRRAGRPRRRTGSRDGAGALVRAGRSACRSVPTTGTVSWIFDIPCDIQHAMVVRGEVARGSVIPERARCRLDPARPSAAATSSCRWPRSLGALVLWEVVSRAGLISQNDLPAMTHDDAGALVDDEDRRRSGRTSPTRCAAGRSGSLIATVLAVPIGIVLGSSELAGARASGCRSSSCGRFPSAVLIPLLFLTLGTTLKSEVFLAAFGAFWPLLVQTIYGVRDVDPVAIDTARSFGVGRLERLYRITLPSAMPYIATGLRISSTVALILAFTAELFMGMPGLGQAMNYAQSYGLNDQLYALAIATGFLGLAVHFVMAALERRVLHWHPSQRRRRVNRRALQRGRDRRRDPRPAADPRRLAAVDRARGQPQLPATVDDPGRVPRHVAVLAVHDPRRAEPRADRRSASGSPSSPASRSGSRSGSRAGRASWRCRTSSTGGRCRRPRCCRSRSSC